LNARCKLNSIHITASIVVGAIIGAVFQSWLASVIAIAVFIAMALHDGSIKPNQGR
jgi:hypothetical protein